MPGGQGRAAGEQKGLGPCQPRPATHCTAPRSGWLSAGGASQGSAPLYAVGTQRCQGRIKKQPELSPFPAFQRKPDITPNQRWGMPPCHRSTSALGPHLCAGHPGAVLCPRNSVSAACPESGPDKLVVAESFSRASSPRRGWGGGGAVRLSLLGGLPVLTPGARRMRERREDRLAECSCLQRTCRRASTSETLWTTLPASSGEFWGSALGL